MGQVREIQDLYLVDTTLLFDSRGSSHSVPLPPSLAISDSSTSILTSFNHKRGTIRGMHYQIAECPQVKLVWCSTGMIIDVVVDLRRDSKTRGQWLSLTLKPDGGKALFIPDGMAHGYQTLADNTTVNYLICGRRSAEHERTLAWNDPTLDVHWPLPVTEISERDEKGESWNLTEYS